MARIFLTMLVVLFVGISAFANPQASSEDSKGDSRDFWPPDLIPHPHPPGIEPSGPSEPEMV